MSGDMAIFGSGQGGDVRLGVSLAHRLVNALRGRQGRNEHRFRHDALPRQFRLPVAPRGVEFDADMPLINRDNDGRQINPFAHSLPHENKALGRSPRNKFLETVQNRNPVLCQGSLPVGISHPHAEDFPQAVPPRNLLNFQASPSGIEHNPPSSAPPSTVTHADERAAAVQVPPFGDCCGATRSAKPVRVAA